MIALHLGVPRTRRWWQTVGRIGFNAEFVAAVDAFLAQRPTTNYFQAIRCYDTPAASTASVATPSLAAPSAATSR